MIYRVTATMHGKRIATSKTFATKADAQKYADETNVFSHFKARVVKERIQQNKEVINRECKLSDEAISIYNSSITKEKK